MRKGLLGSAALLALPLSIAAMRPADAAPVFPVIGASTQGPAISISLTDSGPVITQLTSQTYDGSDDVEVALINSSTTTQTSLGLSGSGNGGGIFGFDGDGIVHYIDANTGVDTVGNPADTTGYAGPGVTFTNISTDFTSGTVDFSLAPGTSTYFGLEGSPNSIGIITPIPPTPPTVPEPASAALLLSGLSVLGFAMRRGRKSVG